MIYMLLDGPACSLKNDVADRVIKFLRKESFAIAVRTDKSKSFDGKFIEILAKEDEEDVVFEKEAKLLEDKDGVKSLERIAR